MNQKITTNQDKSTQHKSSEYRACEIEIFLARCDKDICDYEEAREHYQIAISSVKNFIKEGDYNQIKVLLKLYIEYFSILFAK